MKNKIDRLTLMVLAIVAIAAIVNVLEFLLSYIELHIYRDDWVSVIRVSPHHTAMSWLTFAISAVGLGSWLRRYWRLKYIRGLMFVVDAGLVALAVTMKGVMALYCYYNNNQWRLVNLRRKLELYQRRTVVNSY